MKEVPTKGIFLVTAFEEDGGYVKGEDGEPELRIIPERQFLSVLYDGVGDGVKNTFQRWWITANIHENERVSVRELTKEEALAFVNSDDVAQGERQYYRDCIARLEMNDAFADLGVF